jgi:DNA-binding NtrC family response regulator
LYRLNGVTIELPPLRERLDDVPALVQSFLVQAKQEFHEPDIEGLAPEAVQLLTHYDWPGNVRQLRAVIRRAVLDSVMPVITAASLPDEVKPVADEGPKPTAWPTLPSSPTSPDSLTASEPSAPAKQPAAAASVDTPGDHQGDHRGRNRPE